VTFYNAICCCVISQKNEELKSLSVFRAEALDTYSSPSAVVLFMLVSLKV
jgi:hypothetical protein